MIRLTCPNCGAIYEVDASLVPESGRTVQCSACERTWHARPEPAAATPPPEPQTAEAPPSEEVAPPARAAPPALEVEPPTPAGTEAETSDDEAPNPDLPRRPIAEEVRALLREEAAREARVRREQGRLEVQPDLDLPPGRITPRRIARPRTESGPLPDADAINATLRATSSRAAELRPSDETPRGRGGFGIGLMLVLIAMVLVVGLYAGAPALAERVPQARPFLAAYVELANDVRTQVDRAIDGSARAVADLLERFGEG
ncbi:zinc-ribbon domain-containing protein [Roseitranquillus sediminis]|uniref:zinc-ribbon domain-containing protein n=1 Tax=Roseitranquillus sediminis TaxID=2809051 RepID=UPI0029CA1196|nr:zinc-ribbon domain-containing protein [Roseitranquillus sediminis]MBM9593304.1 zinc-ribbon domain-containing protein [Roseitranquillus sediminis]